MKNAEDLAIIMSTINDRLIALREALGKKKGEFSTLVGLEQSRYSKMEAGSNRPALDAIEQIAVSVPQLNLRWLLTGQGEMFQPEHIVTSASSSKSINGRVDETEREAFWREIDLYKRIVTDLTEDKKRLLQENRAYLERLGILGTEH